MPSRDTLLQFRCGLTLERQWDLPGTHYQKTAEAWLANLDEYRQPITELFAETYGRRDAQLWVQRWRMFFMACAELFGYQHGEQWMVAHYRFIKTTDG